MDYTSPDGKRRYISLDGPGYTAVPVRKSRLVDPCYPPGKLAKDPSDLRKSKPGHAVPEVNRRMLSGQSTETPTPDATVHTVVDEAMPVLKYGAIYHWLGPDQMLRHGVVIGMSATHALLATRDGKFTAPRAKLSPGIHPGAERG